MFNHFPDLFYQVAATRDYVQDLPGDARDFNKAKWIRQNHIYPEKFTCRITSLPGPLYDIPQQFQLQLIPDMTLDIIQFTELKLPETTSTLIEYAAKKLFYTAGTGLFTTPENGWEIF